MHLSVRGLPFEVPVYSLTGDILAFQRCGLQYRYYNRSSLPPSRPVQLWTGEFIHGVLEEAFLYWRDHPNISFPWPCTVTPWPAPTVPQKREEYDLGVLGDRVEERLRASGKTPRSRVAREAAYKRINAAMSQLAPQLFPLIRNVEEKTSSTRLMPEISNPTIQTRRGDRYELTGRVDVISSVSLSEQQHNPLVQRILAESNDLSLGDIFDIVVDYKAARRPPIIALPGEKEYWKYEEWQVQTYAWLRGQQPHTPPIRAGILVYINELSPSAAELKEFKQELLKGCTDVQPINGSADYYALHIWQEGNPVPSFTSEFLLKRAIRLVAVDPANIEHAVAEIDKVINAGVKLSQ